MEDLRLPPIHEPPPPTPVLSMDDYLKFVEFNLKHNFDRKSYEERKKKLAVNVRFSL